MTARTTMEYHVPWFHPLTITILSIVTALALVLRWVLLPPARQRQDRTHAVITGGSSGIGLALAHECVKKGFTTVTLIARDSTKLQNAQKELQQRDDSKKCRIITYAINVSDAKACQETANEIIRQGGPPTILFNNAGTSSSAAFKDTNVEEFQHLITINYLGTVYLTQALLPFMSGGGTMMVTSSMAGLVGVYGYTAYSASKFALRGYCEALQMEVRRDQIRIIMAYPPDTDTPGYQLENVTKPKETLAISDAAGLFTPEA